MSMPYANNSHCGRNAHSNQRRLCRTHYGHTKGEEETRNSAFCRRPKHGTKKAKKNEYLGIFLVLFYLCTATHVSEFVESKKKIVKIYLFCHVMVHTR